MLSTICHSERPSSPSFAPSCVALPTRPQTAKALFPPFWKKKKKNGPRIFWTPAERQTSDPVVCIGRIFMCIVCFGKQILCIVCIGKKYLCIGVCLPIHTERSASCAVPGRGGQACPIHAEHDQPGLHHALHLLHGTVQGNPPPLHCPPTTCIWRASEGLPNATGLQRSPCRQALVHIGRFFFSQGSPLENPFRRQAGQWPVWSLNGIEFLLNVQDRILLMFWVNGRSE